MIRGLLLIGLVLTLVSATGSFLPAGVQVTGRGMMLALGCLLLGATQAGHIFAAMRLPRLTGYLLFGVLVGPSVLGLLTTDNLGDLAVVKKIAVGLIALLAGCELDLKSLRPQLRSVIAFSVSGISGAAVLLFPLFFIAASFIPELASMSTVQRLVIALVTTNAMVAFSPPVVLGILGEVRAKGPMSELWVAIAILADFAIVLSFSITAAIAHGVFPESASTGNFGGVLFHIFGSLLVGSLVGAGMAWFIQRVPYRIGLFVFAVLFVVAEAGVPLHLDPLLVGLAAGLFLENISPVSGAEVTKQTEVASLPTFALFFAVVGAEVHLREFWSVALFAVGAAVLRAAGFFAGTRFGGRFSKADARTTAFIPFGMLPQAGIAIALATAIKTQFPGWGEIVGTLALGTVVVNELIGPILFRQAVTRSGEAGSRPKTLVDQRPFGVDPSIAAD